jgi:hypothetical protein
MPLQTFNTTASHTSMSPLIRLDTDSHILIIDNGCSSSITNCIDDYVSPPWRARANIEGYSGSTSATHVGTVHWKIEDDLGCTHSILLPNTYYSPHGKHRLLCPQHWAQSANDTHLYPNGTWCATYADSIVLYWNQQQYRRTVKLLPNTNVGVICTAPGVQQYAHICSLIEERLGTIAMPTMIDLGLADVSPSDLHTAPCVPLVSDAEGEIISADTSQIQEASQKQSPDNQPFVFVVEETLGNGPPLPEDFQPEFSLTQQELLHWHYHLNHLPFSCI